MCPYGIVADDRIYVMILRKVSETGLFTAVNMGCSVTKLPVKSSKVFVGNRSMSIGDIVEIINMKP